MSFKSLVNKLMKEGKSKEAATKIAGKVASEKMKGAGSGPTAKQKARMKKSPAKKYDRVVLGGNKGDKSKTKPGKKDYEKSPATMSDNRKVKKVAKAKGFPTKKSRGKNRATKAEKMEVKKALSTMMSPAKKPLTGKQKNLPDHLKKAILDAPAKMLSKSGMKMMKEGSPAKMKAPMKKSKQKVEQDYARNAIADYKAGKKKEGNYEKKKALEVAAGEGYFKSPSKMKNPTDKKAKYAKAKEFNKYAMEKGISPNFDSIRKADGYMAESDAMKKFYSNPENVRKMNQGQKEYFSSKGKVLREPSDRGAKSPGMMKTNQDGGGYAAKNMAAPAKQLKKLGSIISKHMKSN